MPLGETVKRPRDHVDIFDVIPHGERRLGWRTRVRDAGVECVLVDAHASPDAADGLWAGTLLDISISGARIDGPTHPRLVVGAAARLVVAGAGGDVIVRRTEPGGREGFVRYGLEFVDGAPDLRQRVNDLLEQVDVAVDS